MLTRKDLDEREIATILAALRFWQEHSEVVPAWMGYFEEVQPLDSREIDDLCERINC